MYIVVIEWDGDVPPRTFYNRMHSLGLFVRGDKDAPPLKRRSIQDGSVIAQEGTVLCASHSLARAVAGIAEELGAVEVSMGTAEVEPVKMTSTLDVQILRRVEEICGKRGRPTGTKTDWVVTCHEEMRSYAVPDKRSVVNCPYCSGLQVYARPGEINRYAFPDSGDVFTAWLRHRFSTGRFENPEEMPGSPMPPTTVPEIVNTVEASIVEIMRKSADFLRQVERLPRPTAASVMDAVLRARAYAPTDIRCEARVKAFIALVEANVDPSKISLGEPHDAVDLLDASELLTPTTAAQLWRAVN